MWNQDRNLPAGMTVSRDLWDNYSFTVQVPADPDGRIPLECPTDSDHYFKAVIDAQPLDNAKQQPGDPLWCPYCGHRSADAWDFMPQQREIALAAATAWAEQKVYDDVNCMLTDSFGKGTRSRGGGFASMNITYTPSPRPPVRTLPTYAIEETRRTITCSRCNDSYAVYGISAFCPYCGELDPLQKFSESISNHRQVLATLADLPHETRKSLQASGAFDHAYNDAIKDGFGALEAYLKSEFIARADPAVHPKNPTVFQRLPEVAGLYSSHLGIGLDAAIGDTGWNRLQVYAAIRHVLTHNQGVIDEKFLERVPEWPQAIGQRVVVSERQAQEFLDVLQGAADFLSTWREGAPS